MSFEPDNVVDYALVRAAAYIADPSNRGKLGPTPVDAASYDKPEIRAAIARIVREAVEDVVPKTEKTRTVTYLSGPNGAKHLLMDAVKDQSNQSPWALQMREALSRGVRSDFALHKQKLVEYGGTASVEPYEQWRPLLSGIDQAIAREARKTNRNFVYDKLFAPVDEPEQQRMLAELAQEKPNSNVQLYAVALTPEEAVAEASKRGIGAHEAANHARKFADFFPALLREIPDVTLVDKNMNILYQQAHSNPQICEIEEIGRWRASCSTRNAWFSRRDGGISGR